MTSRSFTGERILAAILFENTMDRDVEGPTAQQTDAEFNTRLDESIQKIYAASIT